jgi:hypothetical protein
MESRLVNRKNEIERELRLGVRDPRRKRYLLARLLQLERDISSMGFSESDIDKNDSAYFSDKKEIGNKQFYVPLPMWTATDNKKE